MSQDLAIEDGAAGFLKVADDVKQMCREFIPDLEVPSYLHIPEPQGSGPFFCSGHVVGTESFLTKFVSFSFITHVYSYKKQLNTYLIEPTGFPTFDSSLALSTLSRANDRSARGDMINGRPREITGQYTFTPRKVSTLLFSSSIHRLRVLRIGARRLVSIVSIISLSRIPV